MRITIEFDGLQARDAERMYDEVARRLGDLEPAFENVMSEMERIEIRVFGDGELVKTGALRASLTERTADGAIRELHSDGLTFGTSVRYARPAADRADHRILADPPEDVDQIVADYIMGRRR